MAEAPVLTLYQAEWCPFSSAVREVLTELGIDVVLRQVEPWPEERETLRRPAGTDHIPVLQAEYGTFYRGTRAVFAHLSERDPSRFSVAHRRRFAEHRNAGDSAGISEGDPDRGTFPFGDFCTRHIRDTNRLTSPTISSVTGRDFESA